MTAIIEFRSGSFFRALEGEHGSTREHAHRFESAEAADAFMNAHVWIIFNGGMVIDEREETHAGTGDDHDRR